MTRASRAAGWEVVNPRPGERKPFAWLLGAPPPPPRAPVERAPLPPAPRTPDAPGQIVVISSPKGGVGRTTLAAHLAVALLHAGVAAGIADLAAGPRDLTAWLARRAARADAPRLAMPASATFEGGRGSPDLSAERDAILRWPRLLAALAPACDVLIVEAPAGVSALSAAALARADVIITLAADTDVEAEALLADGPSEGERARPGPYAQMIWNILRKRAAAGQAGPAWLLTRTRALDGPPAYAARTDHAFATAARLIGARLGPVVREDVAWRCGASGGLTALDPPFAGAPESAAAAAAVARLMAAAGLDAVEAGVAAV